MTKLLKYISVTTLFLASLVLHAGETATFLPESRLVPGGVAVIKVGEGKKRPVVTYKGRKILVTKNGDKWFAVAGISLYDKPGKKYLKYANRKKSISFVVKSKKYKEQHITLKTNKHVNLSKKDLSRHKGEKKRSGQALTRWSESGQPDLKLLQPVEGRYSSPFGLKRFFNGQPRRPHSGLDIAAPKGSPIVAPANGTVMIASNFFFNGNTIYIDHGYGLVTMYCHMEKLSVKEGDTVKKGQLIGLVGTTGRSTGPHLHWGVALNGSMVDPLIFIESGEEK
ncbi:MAG: M23 family metallopeptidase [Gammaproteobacteria bacterium]|nr:MAG: M23 family metallopeptidase [Gammaproteobacteria bacterium]